MPTTAWNPSDLLEVKNIRAPASLAAAASHDLTTGIDVSQYEYVLVLVTVGATVGVTTVTLQESDTLTVSGGGYTAISGATATFAATADNNCKAIEVRCPYRKMYMNVHATQSTGSATVGIILQGFGRPYSVNYADFTASTAAAGMA